MVFHGSRAAGGDLLLPSVAVFAGDEEVLVRLEDGELWLPLPGALRASTRKGLLILRSAAARSIGFV